MTQVLSTKRLRVIIPILLAMIFAISFIPLAAYASEQYGNCEWEVETDGVLTLAPVSGSDGILASTENTPAPWAWPSSSSSRIISVNIKQGVKANGSIAEMFQMCTNMETADLTNLDTSLTTNMGGLFSGCRTLESVNLSGLKTYRVTAMNGMFSGCTNLKSVNLKGFDTFRVKSMHAMFEKCASLEELDLSDFNTKNVSDMGNMFDGCTALKKVTIGPNFTFKGSDNNGCTLPAGNWLSTRDNKVYTAAQIAASRNGISDTYIKNGTPDPNKDQYADVRGESVYRLYNPNSGEHFYTVSEVERSFLVDVGWRYEGVGWTAPHAGSNVYRMYNPNAGDHFFTLYAAERDFLVRAGWKYEGVSWYSEDFEGIPLYRLYNPNAYSCNHFWTASVVERDWLVGLGWRYEGIGWYGMAD